MNTTTEEGTLDRLREAINLASRWVDNYLGRDFLLHDYSSTDLVLDELDGVAFDDVLFLPGRPIHTLTSVTLGATLLVQNTDYKADLAAGKLYRLGGLDWVLDRAGGTTLKFKGKLGYSATGVDAVPTDLPGYINLATILVAAALSGHNRKESISLEGIKQSVVDRTIPKKVYEMLGRQRTVMA